jgi:hypothetical protein
MMDATPNFASWMAFRLHGRITTNLVTNYDPRVRKKSGLAENKIIISPSQQKTSYWGAARHAEL